jgi:hypothetical protein
MGRYKSNLTDVQNEGGGGAMPLLDIVQKKDAFLWLPLFLHILSAGKPILACIATLLCPLFT